MKYHTLFFRKLGKMSQNVSFAAVLIGALRVKVVNDLSISGEMGEKGEKGQNGLPGLAGHKGDRGQYGIPGLPGKRTAIDFNWYIIIVFSFAPY